MTVRQYLYALNAESGQPVASFGENGRIDLRQELGRDPALMFVSATSPPVVHNNESDYGGGPLLSRSAMGTITLTD